MLKRKADIALSEKHLNLFKLLHLAFIPGKKEVMILINIAAMYIYIHIHTYIYIHTYTHTYKHTYTHIYIFICSLAILVKDYYKLYEAGLGDGEKFISLNKENLVR